MLTSSMFAAGATAPNATDLANLPASQYGAVMSGRINALTTSASASDYGAASGTSTANATEANVYTLSPDLNLEALDLSVELTAAPGSGLNRLFALVVNGTLTQLGCAIAGLATTCNIAGPAVSVPAGSTISIKDITLYGKGANAADALFGFRLIPAIF